uniref:Uncharacterized protein n=1 Tax=Oryza punctata TaxID=4537 RepID=A0A0E0ML57_ORYPU
MRRRTSATVASSSREVTVMASERGLERRVQGRRRREGAREKREGVEVGGDMHFAHQVGVTHYYHIFYEGCLTNFDIGDNGAEATLLYPEFVVNGA